MIKERTFHGSDVNRATSLLNMVCSCDGNRSSKVGNVFICLNVRPARFGTATAGQTKKLSTKYSPMVGA